MVEPRPHVEPADGAALHELCMWDRDRTQVARLGGGRWCRVGRTGCVCCVSLRGSGIHRPGAGSRPARSSAGVGVELRTCMMGHLCSMSRMRGLRG